jgi:tRNA pseudouridine38-40 synthase
VRTFKLTLSYDGTAYAGWQIQARDRTIQGELERALSTILGTPVRAVASGRTDAGVHALAQVVSFACDTRLDTGTLRKALNANLPRDIVVLDIQEAPPGFHAIRDAVRKRYRYVIQDGPTRDVFLRAYAWQIPQQLDVADMQTAAQALLGTHDFSSFETSGSERATSVRTITDLQVRRCGGEPLGERQEIIYPTRCRMVFPDRPDRPGKADLRVDFLPPLALERIVLEVEADGFLYNMVRNIVGTLVAVGRGKQPPSWVAEVLTAQDRKRAGMTAPPQGLFLVQVHYHAELEPSSGPPNNGGTDEFRRTENHA